MPDHPRLALDQGALLVLVAAAVVGAGLVVLRAVGIRGWEAVPWVPMLLVALALAYVLVRDARR